jgi:hypothetical protein
VITYRGSTRLLSSSSVDVCFFILNHGMFAKKDFLLSCMFQSCSWVLFFGPVSSCDLYEVLERWRSELARWAIVGRKIGSCQIFATFCCMQFGFETLLGCLLAIWSIHVSVFSELWFLTTMTFCVVCCKNVRYHLWINLLCH